MHPLIARLLQPEGQRDWDMAAVYIKGRQPLGLDNRTIFNLEEDVLEITNDECPDPFYDSSVHGVQPRICTLSVTTRIQDIYLVDYVKYPKIVAPAGGSKIITSNFGQA